MCGMQSIKFVSLAYMHVTKSIKCESDTTSVSMCVFVCPFVCVYLLCVWCAKYKISIFGMNVMS